MKRSKVRQILKNAQSGNEVIVTFRAGMRCAKLQLAVVTPDRGIRCGEKTGDPSVRPFISRKKFIDGSDGEEFSVTDLMNEGAISATIIQSK